MLAVQRMSSSLARNMNVRLSRDGDCLLTDSSSFNMAEENPPIDLDTSDLTIAGRQGRAYSRRFQVPSSDTDESHRSSSLLMDDGGGDNIYLKPSRRRNSICEQLLQFFFSYKID